MGCDTATDQNGTTVYRADGKITVLDVGGERVLLGSAGNAAIRSVLNRNWKLAGVPKPDATDTEADEWASAGAEAITDILASAQPPLTLRSDGNADSLDGCLLLAWRQHLWIIHTHAALRPYGIATIGSGKELALGSLHTVARAGLVHPETTVSYAIELATRFDSGCGIDERGPIVYSTMAD